MNADDLFIWVPSYEPEESHAPRLNSAQGGDGYSQDAPDGLNHDPMHWVLTFEHCLRDEADAISGFLKSKGGHTPFYWVSPTGDIGALYKCKTWSRSQSGPSTFRIRAQFDQSFDQVNELQPQLAGFASFNPYIISIIG
jgi:phage-related protein